MTLEDEGGSIVGFLSDHNDAEKMISNNQNGSELGIVVLNHKRSLKEKNVTVATTDQGNDINDGNTTRDAGHIWTEREKRKKMKNMFSTFHFMLPHLPPKLRNLIKDTNLSIFLVLFIPLSDEAVSYIQNLEQTLVKLEKQKQERLQYVSTNATFGCDSSVIHSRSLWHPYDPPLITAGDKGSSSNNNYLSNITAVNGTSNNNGLQPAVAFQTWTSPNVVLNIYGDVAQFCICATKKLGILTTITYVLEKYNIEVLSANILSSNGDAYMIQAHAKRASNQFQEAKLVEQMHRQASEGDHPMDRLKF
ncbi:Myc-type, basic helix-loop-helix [Sesbania bispinosa]|nr:Myc-type, basic helix-loop-helix [Sesbania bispinosa]